MKNMITNNTKFRTRMPAPLPFVSRSLSFAQRVSMTNNRVILPVNSLAVSSLSYLKLTTISMLSRTSVFSALNHRVDFSSVAKPLISLSLSNINFRANVYRAMDPIYDRVVLGGKFVIKVHCEGVLLFSVFVDDKIQFSYIVDRIIHQMSLSGASDQSDRCLIDISLHNHYSNDSIMSYIGGDTSVRKNFFKWLVGRRDYSTSLSTSSSSHTEIGKAKNIYRPNIISATNLEKTETKINRRTDALGSAIDELRTSRTAIGNDPRKIQMFIEKTLWANYKLLDNESYIKGLNMNMLDGELKDYINKTSTLLKDECIRLLDYYKRDDIKLKGKGTFVQSIINGVDADCLFNICLVYFIRVAACRNTNEVNSINLVKICKAVGSRIIAHYLVNIKKIDDSKLKYREWLKIWEDSNNVLAERIKDDSYIVTLGAIVVSIWEKLDMIEKKLVKIAKDNDQYILVLKDEKLINRKERSVVNFPNKLPMLVKPNKYSHNELGGYLLNDVRYSESVVIDKNCYALNTEIGAESSFYDMINKISSVPFKINVELLEYVIANNNRHHFVLDPNIPHKYAKLDRPTSYQIKELVAHNSKLLLEQTIFNIVEFYKDFDRIYFPVRADQRGRVYCMPHYFNYQSNELSKALILFSTPGQIHKTDLTAVNYLKLYGVNSFGLSKCSNNEKIKWVNDNLDGILNYETSDLINQASDKLLFLSFCIEYKRYIEFINDDNAEVFFSHLPIQLDASCNGFQHLALLSNEKVLFRELNLYVDEEQSQPKDFYNFLIYKLIVSFEDKVAKLDVADKHYDSYRRLLAFGWNRTHVKEAIMTITYNASYMAMVSYVKQQLFKVDPNFCIPEDDWYTSSVGDEKLVNANDISLLVSRIRDIITNDFTKIKKLTKYLKNVATLLNIKELPIVWKLPNGITIKQSYLLTKSTAISPFVYDKTKINLRVVIKDKYDKPKQIRALMPNLIHSLDGVSLSLLSTKFFNNYTDAQFFSVHDCFGTTMDKVETLKTLLASVYTDIYSDMTYLQEFDKFLLDYLENNLGKSFDRSNRTVHIPDSKLEDNLYRILDINWVNNTRTLDRNELQAIDSQYILI